MNNERKKLYVYTSVNFLLGIIIGIILFYGQLRNNPDVFSQGYNYDKTVELVDFFRVSWLNIMWLFAVFIAHNILPLAAMHPIITIRGCASSFSAMYILTYVGVKEAVVSVLPQCVSVLPLLAAFSVMTVEKRRQLCAEGREPFSMKKSDAAAIFVFSMLAAAAEVLLFRFFCYCLF